MNLNNLKIGKRLMLGFGAVIALLLVLLTIGWIGFNKVQERYWKTSLYYSIEDDLMNARLNSRMFVQYEDKQYAENTNQIMDNLLGTIDKLVPTLKHKKNQEQLNSIKDEAIKYKSVANEYAKTTALKLSELQKYDNAGKDMLSALGKTNVNSAIVVKLVIVGSSGQKYLRTRLEDDYNVWEATVNECQKYFTGDIKLIMEEYISSFKNVHSGIEIQNKEYLEFKAAGDALEKEVVAGIDSMSTQMVGEINSALLEMILIGVIAVILGVVFATIINKSIKVGINKGVDVATLIADGDVSIEFETEYLSRKDEIGDLSRALQKMVDKLREVVESMVAGANNIASASEQTSSTAQELSQGASEQASSVEEISSTMEEMSANIQQNSDNAQQTEKIATLSSEGINKVALAAQNSLSSIRNISDKISIINDIAFQTNILALNAAVEAARAGEHGRGFAVVAAEVRKLAERSKLAANEIVDLAKSSVQVTEDAGKLMMTILPEIEKTAKLVQEIAAASLEQNNGSVQINSAIQQLNAITQQNASASEEMASNAEELTSQAEQLRETVSYFKIDVNQINKTSSKLKNSFIGHSTFETKKTPNKGVSIKLSHNEDSADAGFSNF